MNEELPENHAANVETMKRLMIERRERLAAGEPEREITCTNYANSQNRLFKQTAKWLDGKARK